MSLSVEPIAAWNFNDDALDSIGSEDGTVHGAIFSSSVKKLGSHSIQYDGIDDWLEIPAGDTVLNITGDLSIVIWIKTTELSVSIISFGNSFTGATGYLAGVGQGAGIRKPSFLSSGGGGWKGATAVVNDGNWHQVIYVISGTNLRFFVDGIYDSLHAGVSSPLSHTGERAMGASQDGVAGHEAMNKDTTGIWNAALTYGGVSIGQTAGGDIATLWNGGSGIELLAPATAFTGFPFFFDGGHY